MCKSVAEIVRYIANILKLNEVFLHIAALALRLEPHFYFCYVLKKRIELRWHYRISETFKSVHPRGYPISHSTHVGFSWPPATVCRFGPPVPCSPLPFALLLVGVGIKRPTLCERLSLPSSFCRDGGSVVVSLKSRAFGVGNSLAAPVSVSVGWSCLPWLY